jgi:RimJ/RimL family protein N-acetyltransferase
VPASWSLQFAIVADGSIVGSQELRSEEFAGSRSVLSGSWLTASAQGRGIGTEMRSAVLHLAFAGLGALEARTSAWVDNERSQGVSRKLGYRDDGEMLVARRGRPTRHLNFRLPRADWEATRRDDITVHGLEPCLPLLGAA